MELQEVRLVEEIEMVVVEWLHVVVMVVIVLGDCDVSWYDVAADHHRSLLLLEETRCLQSLISSLSLIL